MAKVGLRELKNSLSAWVRRAERGERVLVTDRGRVVAVIAPPLVEGGPEARYHELVATGVIRPVLQGGPMFGDFKGPRLPAGTARQLIDEDRGER